MQICNCCTMICMCFNTKPFFKQVMNINSGNVITNQRGTVVTQQQGWNSNISSAVPVVSVSNNMTSASGPVTVASNMRVIAPANVSMQLATPQSQNLSSNNWLDGRRVSAVAKEVDPSLQLDDEVEEVSIINLLLCFSNKTICVLCSCSNLNSISGKLCWVNC